MIRAGKFSLITFYERRVRRIFPALIVVLIATGILGYFIFLPAELIHFANSQLAALFSVSNFYFWKQSGYFSAPVETKPLVHTWSLAVEEQFYVFLPIFLYLANKYFRQYLKFVAGMDRRDFFCHQRRGRREISGLHFLSAAYACMGIAARRVPHPWRIPADQVRAAPQPGHHRRAWFGLRIDFWLFRVHAVPRRQRAASTIGAALIVAGGQTGDSFIGRLLSLKPVVFVGLISYSLYLWHWPVIVYQNMGFFLVQGVSSHTIKLACVLVSFILAILSWRFVERPFRGNLKVFTRAQVFQFAAASIVVVAALGLGTLAARGFPARYPENANRMAAYLDYKSAEYFREGTCFISSENRFSDYDYESCLRQDPTKKMSCCSAIAMPRSSGTDFRPRFPALITCKPPAPDAGPPSSSRSSWPAIAAT